MMNPINTTVMAIATPITIFSTVDRSTRCDDPSWTGALVVIPINGDDRVLDTGDSGGKVAGKVIAGDIVVGSGDNVVSCGRGGSVKEGSIV